MLLAEYPEVLGWWIGAAAPDGHSGAASNFFWVSHAPNGTVVSRQRMSYDNWAPSEPNNHLGSEYCVQTRPGEWWEGRWNDISCNEESKSICEIDL
jgi:hypothetical protein